MQHTANTIGPTPTEKLSLRYIADAEPSQPFPWFQFFFAMLSLGIIMIGAFFFFQREQTQFMTHRVNPGETLRTLASQYYGDANQWKVIFLANRKKLMAKQGLVPGDTLKIPILEKKDKTKSATTSKT